MLHLGDQQIACAHHLLIFSLKLCTCKEQPVVISDEDDGLYPPDWKGPIIEEVDDADAAPAAKESFDPYMAMDKLLAARMSQQPAVTPGGSSGSNDPPPQGPVVSPGGSSGSTDAHPQAPCAPAPDLEGSLAHDFAMEELWSMAEALGGEDDDEVMQQLNRALWEDLGN